LKLLKIIALPFLLILIVLQFNFMPRYQFLGGDLLGNGPFVHGLKNWKVNRGAGEILTERGTATFVNGAPKETVMLTRAFQVPSQGEWVLVRAEILVDGVRGGLRSFEKARLYLVGRNPEGKYMWKQSHNVSLIDGTTDWEWQTKAILLKDDMVDLVLGLGLYKATGVMQVRNLSVHAVSELSSFWILSKLLLAVLLFVLIWHAVTLFKNCGFGKTMPGIWIFSGLIMAGVLLPGETKRQIHDFFSGKGLFLSTSLANIDAWPLTIWQDIIPSIHTSFDKLGHLLLFFLITITVMRSFSSIRREILIYYLLIFAATTETLQFFALDRHPSFFDIGVDSTGILLGFISIFLSGAIRRKYTQV